MTQRKTYGYAPQYTVQTGDGHHESFRWADEAEFLLLSDATNYIKTRCEKDAPADIRVRNADGAVLWNRRDSSTWPSNLPTAPMAALIASERPVVGANPLHDTL